MDKKYASCAVLGWIPASIEIFHWFFNFVSLKKKLNVLKMAKHYSKFLTDIYRYFLFQSSWYADKDISWWFWYLQVANSCTFKLEELIDHLTDLYVTNMNDEPLQHDIDMTLYLSCISSNSIECITNDDGWRQTEWSDLEMFSIFVRMNIL